MCVKLLAFFTAIALASTAMLGSAVIRTPCPTEDSTYCYWDASEQGNGQGHDVINLGEGQHIRLASELAKGNGKAL